MRSFTNHEILQLTTLLVGLEIELRNQYAEAIPMRHAEEDQFFWQWQLRIEAEVVSRLAINVRAGIVKRGQKVHLVSRILQDGET